jgi:anti-sigma regulatory factor (Ser/Thr protein kinase)
MSKQLKFEIADASQIGEARRKITEYARQLGFDATQEGKIGIAVNESGSNLLKHAKRGIILVCAMARNGTTGLEFIVLDQGPGIRDVSRALKDGVSTAGTLGGGLGSLTRLATHFDIYSAPGKGTALRFELWAGAAPNGAHADLEVGAVCQAKPGELQCGDDWSSTTYGSRYLFALADGLGHGPDAYKAAEIAVRTAKQKAAHPPASILGDIHAASRATRGAAVAVCAVEQGEHLCRFAGIGNITCAVIAQAKSRHLVSHNGIVGHSMRKVQEFTTPWPEAAILVMHSDGLATQWDLEGYPGLSARHASLVAGVLYRDFARGSDDVTVVVAKQKSAAEHP